MNFSRHAPLGGRTIEPWTLERCRAAARSWAALTAAAVIALTTVVAGSWRLYEVVARRETTRSDLLRLGSSPDATAPSLASLDATRTDFVDRLPTTADERAIVAEFQRAAAAAGVTVGSVQIARQPASRDQLGRVEIALALRGGYPKIKQAIAETLDRFPAATVRRVTWRQAPPAVEAEALMTIAVWLRPTGGER